MGKDLKGRELGECISQLENKKYQGRITTKNGKRIKRSFDTLAECRKWVNDTRYEIEHNMINNPNNITVNEWFEYWITEIKSRNVRERTLQNYHDRYRINIKEIIGDLILEEVKPLHCQMILNKMADRYCNSTIEQTAIVMYALFDSAVENELITKNPVTKSVKCTTGAPSKETRVLTTEERKRFLEAAQNSTNFNRYAFLLQTGLRTGEMIGLKWSDIDWTNKTISITRSLNFRHPAKEWIVGPTKSESGVRTVPLTETALKILKNQQEKIKKLEYINPEFSEYVFLSRKGELTKNSTYDSKIYYYCDKIGLERFSMHTFRHTFATRCIEAGMRPKTLQRLLGHANVNITMNLYVHVTEEEKAKELRNAEKMLKIDF